MSFWENIFFSYQFVMMCISLVFLILMLDELGLREHAKLRDYVRLSLILLGLGISTIVWVYLVALSLVNLSQE